MTDPSPDNIIDFAAKPAASVIYITPAIATRWLERNHVNRSLRESKVNTYARDMAAGNWQLTGEAVKFAVDGRLVDGQHRLHGVVKSGTTIAMFVVRGIAADAQHVMDTGAGRSAADALAMIGHKNAVALAAITRLVVTQESGVPPSNTEIREWIDLYPEIGRAASIAVHCARGCDLAPSTVGLLSWLIARKNGWDEAENFWRAAAELIGLSAGDPILTMRKTFDEYRRAKKKLSLDAQLSIIVRVYNYRRQGKKVTTFLRVNSSSGGLVPVPDVAS